MPTADPTGEPTTERDLLTQLVEGFGARPEFARAGDRFPVRDCHVVLRRFDEAHPPLEATVRDVGVMGIGLALAAGADDPAFRVGEILQVEFADERFARVLLCGIARVFTIGDTLHVGATFLGSAEVPEDA